MKRTPEIQSIFSRKADCGRFRFGIFFALAALLHLALLLLWRPTGYRGAANAQSTWPAAAVRLFTSDYASGVTPAADVPKEPESGTEGSLPEDAASGLPGTGGAHTAYIPPIPLVDIQSVFVYPDQARRRHIQGRVVAELDINANGRVVSVRLIQKAGWGFDEEVMRKIHQVRFSPALRDGLALAATVRIPIEFVLN